MDKIFDLKGKVAIVTGGSRGIGRSIATGLASFGADIVVSDILEKESRETVREIEKLGRNAVFIKTDVSKKGEVNEMARKTVEKFGKVDILVNNAGIYFATPAEDMKEEDWDKILDVNLKGQLLCAREVGKFMIKQKSGSIINVASVAGQFAFAQSAAYNSSKAGVILLTKTLASDWAKHNVRANAIAPGVFATPMTSGLLGDKGFQAMIKAGVPLGRAGKPDELAGAAVFLASEASTYVTGTVITVDGGWTSHL